MVKSLRIALIPLSFLVAASLTHAQQTAQQPLDNVAIIQFVASGSTEDQIVQTIATSAGHYDTGTNAVTVLKQAGVTDKEVDAMRKKNADTYAAAVAAAAAIGGTVVPPGVGEEGVYYKDPQAQMWVKFKPEAFYYSGANTGAGGIPIVPVLGGIGAAAAVVALLPVQIAFAINHAHKKDKNAYILGKTAEVTLKHPVDILIYAPEETSPKDYPLVKLHSDPERPEIRFFEHAGVTSEQVASKRDRQAVKVTKLGFRFYQVSLGPDCQPGEFGILLPGVAALNGFASEGTIFTFRVVE
jgi:hypothetical protein